MHEHFDADDNRTGYTVITRESVWDDESRGRALRLTEYEASICKCGCGLPMSVSHVDQAFKVEKFKCYAGRAIRMTSRRAAEDAKKAKRPEGWDDGLFYFARPATDEEVSRGD